MFQVSFYTFSKKANSTKRPTGAAVTLDCRAVTPTGVLNPSIVVSIDNPTAYNYAYIPSFGRYYYVSEWTADNGFWIASLTVDALASWKTQIGAADTYVIRSSVQKNGDIADSLYPMSTNPSRAVNAQNSGFIDSMTTGTYVVGVVGPGSNFGGVTFYLMSAIEWYSFCDFMFSDPDWLALDNAEITDSLAKGLINPIQYIASCTWYPFPIPTDAEGTYGVSSIKFGWWEFPRSARVLNGYKHVIEKTFALEAHPQASTRGNYLNSAPYTERYFEMYPWGRVDVDSTMLQDVSSVFARCTVDLMHGDALLQTYAGTTGGDGAEPLNYISAQIGVTIPITQITGGIFESGAVNMLQETRGTMFGRMVSEFVGSVHGVASKVSGGSTQTSGTFGGALAFLRNKWKLCSVFWPVTEDDNAHRGRPLMKNATPASLGGYMVVADGDIAAPATALELATIKNHLESGFFYE